MLENTEQNTERIDSNRKRINKLAGDLDQLKNNRGGMNMVNEVAS